MPITDGFALVEQVKENPEWQRYPIMMLSSGGTRGDAARCRALGVNAYLTKPVRAAELHAAIATILNETAIAPALVTRHSIRESGCIRPLNILLAEDNIVNQRLALRILEKEGHYVQLAANGLLALAAAQAHSFDVILMDVQMPEMDGLEATRRIRGQEIGPRVPIVAMTAHALQEDERRCLDAGMDAYLSKPIHAEELLALIEKIGIAADPVESKIRQA